MEQVTYNFEQAMEAVAQGMEVKRATKPYVRSNGGYISVSYDDYKATDWVEDN